MWLRLIYADLDNTVTLLIAAGGTYVSYVVYVVFCNSEIFGLIIINVCLSGILGNWFQYLSAKFSIYQNTKVNLPPTQQRYFIHTHTHFKRYNDFSQCNRLPCT